MAPLCAIAFLCGSASAAEAWLEAGDSRVRNDLVLLADAGVIQLPLLAWPIPMADVDRVLNEADMTRIRSPAQNAALERLRRAIEPRPAGAFGTGIHASAGRAGLLREFDTPAREDAEIGATLSVQGNRWVVEVDVAATSSPADGQSTRLDGSNATIRFGNWLFSLNMLDRWWGPGYQGSLILSNNARPIPAITIDRATSAAPSWRFLRWIGPWRLTSSVGQMENGRQDVDEPLLFTMRVSSRPRRWLEIGLSRTAQFCGDGRICDRRAFEDVIFFNDTATVTVDRAREPGNQLAGWDLRVASPWATAPVAAYWQVIGEDRIDYRPTDRMTLLGVEAWHAFENGDVLRGYAEYSDSACDSRAEVPNYDCAYNHHIFFADGYRYRGRPIGHTTDGDSQLRAFGLRWQHNRGEEWRLSFRNALLNRGPGPDPNNTVSAVGADYEAIELGWRGEALGGKLDLLAGYQRVEPLDLPRDSKAYGFVTWRKAF
jgi:hypothetical protein